MRGYEIQWKWQPLDLTRIIVAHTSIKISSEYSSTGIAISKTPGSPLVPTNRRFAQYTELAESSAPRRSSSFMLMQKLPFGIDFSLTRYWVRRRSGRVIPRLTNTTERMPGWVIHSIWAGSVVRLPYTVQSLDGAHIEQRKVTDPSEQTARIVDRRHWVSLRLDF
jgi:iron complex outermembrane recepter protein